MKHLMCIAVVVGAFAMWGAPADATGPSAGPKPPFDVLTGIWAEDCHAAGQVVVITPTYHATVVDWGGSIEALGLGKIKSLRLKGDEVNVVFSSSFLRQVGEASPRYRLSGQNEIIALRDAAIWKASSRLYREDVASRPEGYVSIDDHEYGMRYHRCNRDRSEVEKKMRQIVAENRRWLKPQTDRSTAHH